MGKKLKGCFFCLKLFIKVSSLQLYLGKDDVTNFAMFGNKSILDMHLKK